MPLGEKLLNKGFVMSNLGVFCLRVFSPFLEVEAECEIRQYMTTSKVADIKQMAHSMVVYTRRFEASISGVGRGRENPDISPVNYRKYVLPYFLAATAIYSPLVVVENLQGFESVLKEALIYFGTTEGKAVVLTRVSGAAFGSKVGT